MTRSAVSHHGVSWALHCTAILLMSVILLVWFAALAWTARPTPTKTAVTAFVVFNPIITADAGFAAIVHAGGRPIRQVGLPFLWVVNAEGAALAKSLWGRGLVFEADKISLPSIMIGCVSFASGTMKTGR